MGPKGGLKWGGGGGGPHFVDTPAIDIQNGTREGNRQSELLSISIQTRKTLRKRAHWKEGKLDQTSNRRIARLELVSDRRNVCELENASCKFFKNC